MISNIFKSLLITISVMLAVVLLIATVYIAMWFIAGLAIVLLFISVYHVLRIKENL